MWALLTDRRTIGTFVLLLAALVVQIPGPAHACAVCGFGQGTPGDPVARGFYWGVLFLVATPFTIVGAFGGWLAYMYWRARRGGRMASPVELLRAKLRAPLKAMAWTQKESES